MIIEKSIINVNLAEKDILQIRILINQLIDTFGTDIKEEDVGEFIFSIYNRMLHTRIKDFEVKFNYED